MYLMRFLIPILLLIMACGQPELSPSMAHWLQGKWKSGADAFEEWELKDGVLHGVGYRQDSTKKEILEYLQIEKHQGSLVLKVDLNTDKGKQTVVFPLQEINRDWIIFLNEAHDYPQRIAYRKIDHLEINAEISLANGERKVIIPFDKVEE